MRAEICRAFCEQVVVRDVPVGLAVSTGMRRPDGDAIVFYVVKAGGGRMARLEDDGETIPYLEACGVDLETQTREKAFASLLAEYGAEFDPEAAIIRTQLMPEDAIPRAALSFALLLLRLCDFLLLTQDHVESAFRDDVKRLVRDAIGDRAQISEDQPVSVRLREVVPDILIRAEDRTPVAVFLAQSSQRVSDAIFLQMAASYEAGEDVAVIALLEADTSVPRGLRQRASNRLAAVPVFFGDEVAAIQRITTEAIGAHPSLH